MYSNPNLKLYDFDYNINYFYFFIFIIISSFIIIIVRNNHDYTLIPSFDIEDNGNNNEIENGNNKDIIKEDLSQDKLFRESHF